MTFSARSFALVRSSSASARSRAGSFERGRVPLIGFVSTWPSRTRRNRSGDEQTILPSGKSRYAANGAGLISRKPQVRVPRVALGFGLESLREIHLIAIAAANVLLHCAECGCIRVAVEVGLRAAEHAKRRAAPAAARPTGARRARGQLANVRSSRPLPTSHVRRAA